MPAKFFIQSANPDKAISHFVHSFWALENKTGKDIPATVLPNGMVDLIVMRKNGKDWIVTIRGIDTEPSEVKVATGTKMFSIGFKLLAVEYFLGYPVRKYLNKGKSLATDFWKFGERDLVSLKSFCKRATQIIQSTSPADIDNRKIKLFDLIYASHGDISVRELSEQVYWSSRQINRYFNEQFGIPLKTYCNILRIGESFKHISEGKLYPELNYTDQNHFIKEVKKYTGATPKELRKNKDDRFVNISAIKRYSSK